MLKFEDPRREARFWKLMFIMLLHAISNDEFRTTTTQSDADILRGAAI